MHNPNLIKVCNFEQDKIAIETPFSGCFCYTIICLTLLVYIVIYNQLRQEFITYQFIECTHRKFSTERKLGIFLCVFYWRKFYDL